MPQIRSPEYYLNSDISQVPLAETERRNHENQQAHRAFLQRMHLHQTGQDVLPNKVAPFTRRQLQSFEQADALNEMMRRIGQNPQIRNLINEGHEYRPFSTDLERRMHESESRNPLETKAYSDYLENPRYKRLRDIYRQEATEHFKKSVLPAVRTWHALHGSTNSSSRANAEAEELSKFNARMSRDLTKMVAEQHEKAADYALQNEHRGKEERAQELAGRIANKAGFLQTAEAHRAADQNLINNELKRAQIVGGVGGAEQELESQKLAQEHARAENANEFEMNAVRNLMSTTALLPPSLPSTTQISSPAPNIPVNALSAVSGIGQQMYSHLFPPQKAPGMKKGGRVPHFAEGGEVAMQPPPGTAPQPQELPPMPAAEYTPEQRILLQMVQDYKKKDPLARMFETTGANQLANLRGSPMEAFGEGVLKHQQIERDQTTAHADIIKAVGESRNDQHKLLSEMGFKKRELDIDETYKKGELGISQQNANTDKAYKEAHAKQLEADTALKELELAKGKGGIEAKKAIANFGLEDPNISQSSILNGGLGSQNESPKNLDSLISGNQEMHLRNEKQPNRNELSNIKSQLLQIREMRAPYGGAELKDDERKTAHAELTKARELKNLTEQGLKILKRMGELNPKISTGSLLSRAPGFLQGAANNIRGNWVPWEKGSESEIDEFDNLSNSLVAVEKNIDALGGGGKGSAGIGFINFLQAGKPAGDIGTKANEREIKRYADKYKYLNNKNSFITRACGEYMLTPDEAESIFDKLENQGINPIDIFEDKKKTKEGVQEKSISPKDSLTNVNSRIAQLENELGVGQ